MKIGLISTVDGGYAPAGAELRRGFALYLAQRDGRLGGREIAIYDLAEGATPPFFPEARDNVAAVLASAEVTALVGGFHATTTAAVKPLADEHGIPFLSTNARPTDIGDLSFFWHTGQLLEEAPAAVAGPIVGELGDTPLHLVGFDSPALADSFATFAAAFMAAGGNLVGETYFPSSTTDFSSYVAEIARSRPGACYVFGAMSPGVELVREFRHQLGDVPLYGPGWLTETVVDELGADAVGIRTASFYATDLHNPVNDAFVIDYQARFGVLPSFYAVTSYDAAAVLDAAVSIIPSAIPVTPSVLTVALATVGSIESPRGTWRFGAQKSPEQSWYLREVRVTPDGLRDVAIGTLDRVAADAVGARVGETVASVR